MNVILLWSGREVVKKKMNLKYHFKSLGPCHMTSEPAYPILHSLLSYTYEGGPNWAITQWGRWELVGQHSAPPGGNLKHPGFQVPWVLKMAF